MRSCKPRAESRVTPSCLRYAVAQHPALEAVADALQPGEGVFAFLDDIYIVCAPERVATFYGVLAAALWDHARVQLNQGKTRVWNAAGEEPPNLAAVQPDPSSATGVWVGVRTFAFRAARASRAWCAARH